MRRIATVFVVLLVSCVGLQTLDTFNKKLASFEIGYKAALVQIDQMDKANQFKPETKLKVADGLEQVNKARKDIYAALALGDTVKAGDNLSIAITALDALKALVPAGGQI